MKIISRIIADIVLLGLIFIVPWWFSIILIAAGIFIFSTFYEAFFLAVLLDGFYGASGISLYGYNLFFTFCISAIFILAVLLKNRLKFYS